MADEIEWQNSDLELEVLKVLSDLIGKVDANNVLSIYPTLRQMATEPTESLAQETSLSPKKARLLRASFKLAKCLLLEDRSDTSSISSPKDVFDLQKGYFLLLNHEVLRVLAVDRKNRIVHEHSVTTGAIANISQVLAKDVLRPVVQFNASALVMTHNHPSGDPTPSKEDIEFTKQIQKAAEVLQLELLDHVIIGGSGFEQSPSFSSLRELGYV